jgi:hypothetical protein
VRTIEKQVYNIDEIDQKAFEKAYNHWREHVGFWDECIIEDMQEELKTLGVEDPKIRYSGFWSQGDGASFTGRLRDVEAFLCRKLTRHERYIIDNTCIKFVPNSTRYVHENTVTTGFNFDYRFNNYALEKIACQLESEINDTRIDLCHNFYRRLETDYNYQMSEDSFTEHCEANDMEFYKTGGIYYE